MICKHVTRNAFHHARKLVPRQSRSWLIFTGLQINEHAIDKKDVFGVPVAQTEMQTLLQGSVLSSQLRINVGSSAKLLNVVGSVYGYRRNCKQIVHVASDDSLTGPYSCPNKGWGERHFHLLFVRGPNLRQKCLTDAELWIPNEVGVISHLSVCWNISM